MASNGLIANVLETRATQLRAEWLKDLAKSIGKSVQGRISREDLLDIFSRLIPETLGRTTVNLPGYCQSNISCNGRRGLFNHWIWFFCVLNKLTVSQQDQITQGAERGELAVSEQLVMLCDPISLNSKSQSSFWKISVRRILRTRDGSRVFMFRQSVQVDPTILSFNNDCKQPLRQPATDSFATNIVQGKRRT